MNDTEKLAELINHVCEGHVENLMQPGGVEALADHLITHGVTAREPQKPLTVEEFMEIPGSVWYENDTVIIPMMVSNQKSFSVLYLKDVVFGLYRSCAFDSFAFVELPVSDYGKTWRCWAEKPTEGERKAAEWLK